MSGSRDNPTARVAEIAPLRISLWMALAAFFLWAGFEKLYHIGHNFDWYLFTHHLEVARRTYVEYGQFPAWNPYYCGGVTEIGNLQASAAAPVNVLMAWFGTVPGMKLGFWLFLVLGQEGTYQYARHHDVRGVGALAAAAAFAFSGRFASPIVNGHPMFFGFLFMPWIFLGLEKGVRSWWWGVIGGLFMGWIFAKGGAVPTPMISVVLALLTLFLTGRALVDDDCDYAWYRPALTLAWMALITCAFMAVRTLPVLETLIEHPRELQSMESYSLTAVVEMLFVQTSGTPNSYNGTATSYIGLPVLGLALYGLVCGDKRAGRMFLFVVICFVLAMGGKSPLWIYHGLKSLPVFDNLRAPFRYANFVVFFLAVGAGRGVTLLEQHLFGGLDRWNEVDWITRWPYGTTAYRALVGIVVGIAVTGVSYLAVKPEFDFNKARVDETFTVPWPRPYEQPFRQTIGNRWHANVWPVVNRGSLACWEAQPFFQSGALRADLDKEEFLKDDSKGRIERISWSPHRIVLDVSVDEEARVVVNQNKHRAWSSNIGEVTSDEGRLAVDVPAGEHRLVIEFSDPLVQAGMAISIVTILLMLGAGGWRHRRRWISEGDTSEESSEEAS